MVHYSLHRGMWSFLEPFDPSLWLALFGTSALVGLMLLLSEAGPRKLWRAPAPALDRMAGLQWGSLLLLLRASCQVSGACVSTCTSTSTYTLQAACQVRGAWFMPPAFTSSHVV
jgi:hypothetical protein